MNWDIQTLASAVTADAQLQITDISLQERLNWRNDFTWLPYTSELEQCTSNKHHGHHRKLTYQIIGQNLKYTEFVLASVNYAAVPVIGGERLRWAISAVVDRVIYDHEYMNYQGSLTRKTFNDCTKERVLELAKQEAKNMENLRHPHLVLLVATYEQKLSFSILMYHAAKKNLEKTLQEISEEV